MLLLLRNKSLTFLCVEVPPLVGKMTQMEDFDGNLPNTLVEPGSSFAYNEPQEAYLASELIPLPL